MIAVEERKQGNGQPDTWQAPDWHVVELTPTGAGLLQLLEQEEQAVAVEAVFVSQPSIGFALQLANPPIHGPATHMPPMQTGAPVLGVVGHTVPQEPQLTGSVCTDLQTPPHETVGGMQAVASGEPASVTLPSGSFGKSTDTLAMPLRFMTSGTPTGGVTATTWTTGSLTQFGVDIGETLAHAPPNAFALKVSLPSGSPSSAKTVDAPTITSNSRSTVRDPVTVIRTHVPSAGALVMATAAVPFISSSPGAADAQPVLAEQPRDLALVPLGRDVAPAGERRGLVQREPGLGVGLGGEHVGRHGRRSSYNSTS